MAESLIACPVCSASLRPGARFCDRCGAATDLIAGPDSAGPVSTNFRGGPRSGSPERRQTTVLFCDLVDSTRLSVQLDPEDLREVLHSFREVARAVVARHEGFIASYLGDGVLVLFGYPQAHEDDPQRAVRVGSELVAAVPKISTRHGQRLEARVGIATGLTVIGPLVASGSSFDEVVVGQTTNLAARLQAISVANTVVISDVTKRLVDRDFECKSLGTHALKGFDQPVLAWQVLRERGENDSVTMKISQRQLTLVGRQRELEVLGERWRMAQGGAGSLVVIQGEPGVGKSRLVQALRETISDAPHTVLRYNCAPRFQNTALFPVIHELERAAGFAPEDPALDKLDKLEAFLGAGGQAEDVKGVSAILASLLSVPFAGRYAPIDDSPEKQRARTFEALKGVLFANARVAPVLLIIEDVHWADPTTIQLLGEILAEVVERRILVVVTERLGFGGTCPPCASSITLELKRMTAEDSRQMIEQLMAGKQLAAEVVEHIAQKSEGVPLFTEELTKMALEYGGVDDTGQVRKSPSASVIPSTLQDSLAARLDRLAPVKELVRAASAIGREFRYDLLAEVLKAPEADMRASLSALISADIVYLQDENLQTYSFKHVLLQEAAYAMMVRSARQQLHKRIADVLETRPADVRAIGSDTLAHHLVEAGETLSAIPYLELAAERASARAAYTEARRQLLRGLELLGETPSGVRREEFELRLSVALGLAASATQGYAAPEVESAYQRSLDLSRRLGKTNDVFPALRGLCTFYIVRGALETARDVAQECLELAESNENPADVIDSLTALGYTLVYQGALVEGSSHLARAVSVYRECGGEKLSYPSLQDPAVASLGLLAIAKWMTGQVREAERLQKEALELTERLGRPFNQAYAHSFAALFCNVRHEFADAATHAGIAQLVANTHGFTVWLGAATIHRSIALGNTGETATAIPTLVHMLGLWRAGGAELSRPVFSWGLARCCAAAGDTDGALQAVDDALQTSKRTSEGLHLPEIHRLHAELLHQRDASNVAAWQGPLREAISSARTQSATVLELRALRTLASLSGDTDDGQRRRISELQHALREAGASEAELEVPRFIAPAT